MGEGRSDTEAAPLLRDTPYFTGAWQMTLCTLVLGMRIMSGIVRREFIPTKPVHYSRRAILRREPALHILTVARRISVHVRHKQCVPLRFWMIVLYCLPEYPRGG